MSIRPIAGLGLLFHHVLLQSWSSTGEYPYCSEAQKVLDSLLGEFPSLHQDLSRQSCVEPCAIDGGLFLFFNGRYQRLLRNIPAVCFTHIVCCSVSCLAQAEAAFHRAIEVQVKLT